MAYLVAIDDHRKEVLRRLSRPCLSPYAPLRALYTPSKNGIEQLCSFRSNVAVISSSADALGTLQPLERHTSHAVPFQLACSDRRSTYEVGNRGDTWRGKAWRSLITLEYKLELRTKGGMREEGSELFGSRFDLLFSLSRRVVSMPRIS